MPTKLNVLLIIADQFRGDLLTDSPLGAVAHLPHLRELMDAGVTFPQHFSVTAPCGPSRVSMLTGQYAMNHRAVRNGTPLRHDTPTLATQARKAGYIPQVFGYTDTAQDPRVLAADDPRLHSYEELMSGFDETVRMRQESDDKAWRKHLAKRGVNLPPYPDAYIPDGPDLDSPALYSSADSDTAWLTDQFMDRMTGADPGWFAALTYVRPHPPLVAPAPYNKMYSATDMPPALHTQHPDGDRDWHPFMAPSQDKQPPASMVEGFPDLDPSDQTTAKLRALYLGLASEVDHHIGRIMAWLKETGQWEDTIVVFTADHGEMLGDFGQWGKASIHDAAYHVPLVIRDPARPRPHGRVVAGMSESIDLPVTLLDRIGAPIADAMNGQSLIPWLDDPATAPRRITFSEYDFGDPTAPTVFMEHLGTHSTQSSFAVLRTETERLVHFACGLPPIVFDMAKAGEKLDVSGKNPEKLLDLTQKMLCHRMINSEATFSRTMVGAEGVVKGSE